MIILQHTRGLLSSYPSKKLAVTEVAAYGDSITSGSTYETGTPDLIIQHLTSYMFWAQAYSGNRFELMSRGTVGASVTDFGFSGARVSDLANGATYASVQPMALLLAKSPQVVVELSGTNDVINGTQSASTIASARIANWDYMLANGVKRIIAIAIPPCRTAAGSTTQTTLADATNVLLEQATQTRNITWVPYPSVFKTAGSVDSNYFRDDIHPNHLGAQILGQAVANALLPYVQSTDFIVPEDGSSRWITGNPYQAGSVSVGGGQAATGWRSWFGYTSPPIVPSKVTDSQVWQRLTTSGQTVTSRGVTSAVPIWNRSVSSANVNAGTMVRAVARIRTTSSSIYAFQVRNVQNEVNRGSGCVFGTGFGTTQNYPLPLNNFDLTFIGPRIPMKTTTSTNIWVYPFGNGVLDIATCGVITA